MLGPGEPAAADRIGLAAKRLVGEGQGDPRGVARLAGVRVAGKGPFQRLGGLVGLSGPPGCRAQPLEVIGREAAPSLSAATNASIASAQACRSIASRPSSSVSTMVRYPLLPATQSCCACIP